MRPTLQLFQQCQGSFPDQASRVLLPKHKFLKTNEDSSPSKLEFTSQGLGKVRKCKVINVNTDYRKRSFSFPLSIPPGQCFPSRISWIIASQTAAVASPTTPLQLRYRARASCSSRAQHKETKPFLPSPPTVFKPHICSCQALFLMLEIYICLHIHTCSFYHTLTNPAFILVPRCC